MPGRALLLPAALLLLLLACTPSHSSPLHDAAVNQDIVLLQQLLDSRKYDVNGLDANGRTPLAAALATCSNYTGRFPRMVPNGELQFCATASSAKRSVSSVLVCAGANVNVDVFPKERPGYKLVHLAACSSPPDLWHLLSGGANPNAPYRLPDGHTVTPLTWAALCTAANKNSTEYGYPGSSIQVLLDAGANPLPVGPANPATALLWPTGSSHPLSKCNKPGACSFAEMQRLTGLQRPFPKGFVYNSWRPLWEAQEVKAANPNMKPKLASWLLEGKGWACGSARASVEYALMLRQEAAAKQG